MTSSSRPPPIICDFAIDSPWEAREPFLQRELNSQKALGLILDRRAWWHSWTATHGAERARWMLEVDEFLVRMNLVQLSKVWKPLFLDWDDVVARLREATVLPMGSSDKQVALDGLVNELVAKIQSADPYEHYADGSENSSEGEWDDSVALTDDDEEMEGEEDSEDEQMLDDDDNVVSFEEACRQRQRMGRSNTEDHRMRSDTSETSNDEADPGSDIPFGQVAWVAGLMVLRQRLLALAPRQATSTAIDRLLYSVPMLETAETMTRAFELIMAGLRAVPPCSIDAVQSLIPVTLEPATLRKLQHHFQLIRARIEEVKQHIATTLDIIIDQLKLVPPDGAVTTTDVCTPGPVLMTWMRDACITPTLKAKLSAELADLRPPPSQQSDTVHDLVDPSLYCSVVGRTKYQKPSPTADTKPNEYATPALQMRATMDMKPTSDVYTRSRKDTKYGWLPCEVHIADSETATNTILTYINNLHPETYASLYKSIEQLFSQCVPVFENVLSSLDREADKRLLKALYQYGGLSLPSAPRLVPRGLFDVNPPLQSLRGKQCQVVVRIREIKLTPEQPTFGGDDWHDEGTETEQIIATGVVFYRVDNLTEPRFTCRTFVKCPRHGTHDKFTIGLEYGLYYNELVAQELGQITAVEDRCVVVPNLYQYKLEPFGLKDPTRPGTLACSHFCWSHPHQWQDQSSRRHQCHPSKRTGSSESERGFLRSGAFLSVRECWSQSLHATG